MGKYGEIFAKLRLTPNQLRTVADRRLDDAVYLVESGENARANGSIYLGGFAVECWLKAGLLERHRNLGSAVDPARLSASDREVYRQLYSHELDEMIDALPELALKLERQRTGLRAELRTLAAEWSVYARHSPRIATIRQAKAFLGVVSDVRPVLRDL